jgi:hypothetical protein
MARQTGAPDTDATEITPAMIEAGADVISQFFYDAVVPGAPLAREAARAVFLAMRNREVSGLVVGSRHNPPA